MAESGVFRQAQPRLASNVSMHNTHENIIKKNVGTNSFVNSIGSLSNLGNLSGLSKELGGKFGSRLSLLQNAVSSKIDPQSARNIASSAIGSIGGLFGKR